VPIEPIVESCRDPAHTRAIAAALSIQSVPCYRCLAYRPATVTGCHFLETRPTNVTTTPKRRPRAEQTEIW
jgi:hypothetical protein